MVLPPRLNLNGPNDLSKFSPNKYTDDWVKRHMRIDDMMHEPKKKRIRLGSAACSEEGESGNGESTPNVMSGQSILF